MALFQLDPVSIASRVHASGKGVTPPNIANSILRGIIGFTVVSVAGFLPWPFMDRFLPHPTEMQLYLACTVLFIVLSGPCLHRLIIGPGSLLRFYKVFALAFIAYAVVWVALWMALRGDTGSFFGLLGGTAAMGAVLAFAFGVPRIMPQVILALFTLNSLGYYAGGKIEGHLAVDHRLAAMLLWGACYGIGFGAGLGVAFYLCQTPARALLRERSAVFTNSRSGGR